MHEAVQAYISKVKEAHPSYFKNVSVLELGSQDYNGTPRDFFENCKYVGVDWMAGSGVDIVAKAHEFQSKKRFDVVITTEMLEHDAYAKQSILNGLRLLKKGGIFIGTCANVNRPPHYEFTGENEHYKNVSSQDIRKWVKGKADILDIEEDGELQDLRFVLRK